MPCLWEQKYQHLHFMLRQCAPNSALPALGHCPVPRPSSPACPGLWSHHGNPVCASRACASRRGSASYFSTRGRFPLALSILGPRRPCCGHSLCLDSNSKKENCGIQFTVRSGCMEGRVRLQNQCMCFKEHGPGSPCWLKHIESTAFPSGPRTYTHFS